MDCKNQKLSEGSASTKKIKVNKTKYKKQKFSMDSENQKLSEGQCINQTYQSK